MNILTGLLPTGAALTTLLLSSSLCQANSIADSVKVRGGILACSGSHFSRVAGNEQHRTSYVLRNFSGDATITIDRFQLFDANGNVRFAFPETDLPVNVKTELAPHETTQINSDDILSVELGPADRPVQSYIEWSYSKNQKDVTLDGSTIRTVRATDTGIEQSRASSECKLIDYWR